MSSLLELLPLLKPAFIVKSRPLKTSIIFTLSPAYLEKKPVLMWQSSPNGALKRESRLSCPRLPPAVALEEDQQGGFAKPHTKRKWYFLPKSEQKISGVN